MNENLKPKGVTRWSESSHNIRNIDSEISRAESTRQKILDEHKKAHYPREDIFVKNQKWIEYMYPKIQSQITTFLESHGIDTTTLTWIPAQNIIPTATVDQDGSEGTWSLSTETIELNINKHAIHTDNQTITHMTTSTLRHELLHSISRNSIFLSGRNSPITPSTYSSLSGVNRVIRTILHSPADSSMIYDTHYFQVLNEGLTELINTHIETDSKDASYKDEVHLVTTIISSITEGSIPQKNTGIVSQEVHSKKVFDMFVDTYMNHFSRTFKMEIRENFGALGLSLLSFLEVGDLDNEIVYEKILTFFSATRHTLDPNTQEYLHQQIIPRIMMDRSKRPA